MRDVRTIKADLGDDVTGQASFSPCERYRYTLNRVWANPYRPLTFVMLNPSTADAFVLDPTIRRCIGYARREGFNAVEVVNLFAFRATKPEDMYKAADPIGPWNDETLVAALTYAQLNSLPVVAAWGAHGRYMERGPRIAAMARARNVDLRALAITKGGAPGHPLYLPSDAPLVPFTNPRHPG